MASKLDSGILAEISRLPDEWRFVVCNGYKTPLGKEWNKNPLIKQDFISANGTFRKLGTIKTSQCKAVGVLCGIESGGLLILDHDGNSADGLIENLSGMSVEDALPETAKVTSGREGRYSLFYKIPDQFCPHLRTVQLKTNTKVTDYVGDDDKYEGLEFRWTGQSVILGQHPHTGSYKWLRHPEDGIAVAPHWMIEQMLTERDESATRKPKYSNTTIVIPLLKCCAIETRESIEGKYNKGRNSTGAQIARDLIGTSQYLSQIGQPYEGNPESIFFEWCNAVGLDGDKPKGQPNKIWESALRSNPTPCLSPDKIEGCIRAYERRASKSIKQSKKSSSSTPIAEENDPPEFDPTDWTTFRTPGTYDELSEMLAKILEVRDLVNRKLALRVLSNRTKFGIKELDAVCQRIKDSKNPQFKRVISAKEFLEMDEEEAPGWVIPEMIPEGDMMLLTGQPGIGKSLMAYEIAYQVATGGEFAGNQIEQGPVLLIQLDEREKSIRSRLGGRGFWNLENVKMIKRWRLSQLEELETDLIQIRPRLVIIDNLRKVISGSGVDENKAEIGEQMDDLLDLFSQYKVGSIMIHHNNKSTLAKGQDKISGSTAIASRVFSGFSVEKPTEDDRDSRINLMCTKMRDGKKRSYEFEHVSDDGWHIAFNREINVDLNELSTVERIVHVLNMNSHKEWFSTSEIRELLGMASNDKSIYKALDRAANKGLIDKKTFKGAKNKPRVSYRRNQKSASITNSVDSDIVKPLPSIKNSESTNTPILSRHLSRQGDSVSRQDTQPSRQGELGINTVHSENTPVDSEIGGVDSDVYSLVDSEKSPSDIALNTSESTHIEESKKIFLERYRDISVGDYVVLNFKAIMKDKTLGISKGDLKSGKLAPKMGAPFVASSIYELDGEVYIETMDDNGETNSIPPSLLKFANAAPPSQDAKPKGKAYTGTQLSQQASATNGQDFFKRGTLVIWERHPKSKFQISKIDNQFAVITPGQRTVPLSELTPVNEV